MYRLTDLVPVFLAAATLGCSAGGGSEALSLGTDGTGGSGKGGAGSGAGGVLNLGGGLTPNALAAHIESPPGVTVTVVTLSCANDCADVVAVAEGGFAPYTFQWEDGSTDPARHVCPSATSTFVVSATDSGSTSGEFARDPQTVEAHVTANVIQCPSDGGAPSGTGGTSAGGTGGAGTGAGGAGTGGSVAATPDGGPEACGAGFKPGQYDGTFKQTLGPLSGTHHIVFTKSASTATEETIRGKLDNALTGTATTAQVTWGDGSIYYCAEHRLFLTGVRSEPGTIIPLPYTYEATYDPSNDTLQGRWASAAPSSLGVYPTSALDSGTWDAHWVGP